MLTGKQRSYLKSIANTMEPIFQVGKNGITENFIKQVDDALEARELIKIKVLNNSLLDATEVANQISEEIDAEFVQSIGNKFVLYKESKENKKIELPN
ncbi:MULTISPECIES: ribosome assembly RNA-binding protein YhbY [Tissierella]|uniref:RNA-binding protein n=1 Tax=Tissierella praeacuta DSM 18095 TaxID=1123404 RepID=A0A1M4S7D1_9FIRM|nr:MULTISPECIES: ribosome assembly RNA-binding protein YhbY [Tissierella]MBU5256757.1 ribosome assembly RNA-binding protein YhbY [Tissierella praeacuta]TCU71668.1 RNA-binding protein [Tissierella praeacuta]SHE27937.1 RNA-binding protein [Tissierella praeacuta DSM 18095]SUP01013.1 RNA-binding protein YhbY [Tissierella praeacuta]